MTLQRKLPHKKMLIGVGLLITWVLVVMAGTTVQTLQVAGWLPVHPVEGLRLPYWVGLWFGVFPTWEGLAAQTAGAATFVLGSYLRGRAAAEAAPTPDSRARLASSAPGTIRTCDLCLRRAALYPLSYGRRAA